MKKKIIIFCAVLITLSLTGFGVINWNGTEVKPIDTALNTDMVNDGPVKEKIQSRIFTDFIYDVGTRYSGIRKGVVNQATTIDAFFDEEQLQHIESLKSVEVIVVVNNKRTNIREKGYDKTLTKGQLKLLRNTSYSKHFLIRAEFEQYNSDTGYLEARHSSPHYTIVPESQARYADGKLALKNFLKEGIKEVIADVDPEKLKPAKLHFTVTKTGSIKNVQLDRPSGYPEVDETMMELITQLPGVWVPAKNTNGEHVDMELVVSFGLMGC